MPQHSGAPDKDHATKEKSGSTDPRNYDPQNDMPSSGGGGPGMDGYSPAEQKPQSGPGNAPGSDRGSDS